MFVRGSKNSKLFAPSRLQFREHMVAVWNASLLLCWQFAIQTIMTLGRSRHPKRRGLLRFKDHRAFRFTNSKPSINKKPRPVTGAWLSIQNGCKVLHLWLALFGLGVPNAACLGAVSLCLRLRHVR